MTDIQFGFERIKNRLGINTKIALTKGGEGFEVSKTDDGVAVRYCEKRDLFRALTFVKEVEQTGKTVCQSSSFDMLCYMVDMSRNAVMNMDSIKDLITDLAMMGYNSMMLYIEDTYEVPEYPYFGHMRGRYTKKQMKEIDSFGNTMGIEVIPCMQTLAHLATFLRWKCCAPITDAPGILLAECDETYHLIDCMFKSLSECFTTDKIHIGMDEAHNLGLGKYLDLHGYTNRFEILERHLIKVKELCEKYSLKPMIWSDMYFRLYNHGVYYMSQGELTDDITSKVPEGVDIVYWDYYSKDNQILDCMFENHAKFGRKTIFAGGAWKWSCFAPYGRVTHECANIHIDACMRHGCKDIIVTGWGDNGGEAAQYSILPGLAIFAERCFEPDISDEKFAKRFEQTFDISLKAFFDLDLANEIYDEPVISHSNPCKFALYNGVIGGLMDAHIPENAGEKFAENKSILETHTSHPRFGYMFSTLAKLCSVLELKANMSQNIRKAYLEGDKDTLCKYANEIIPETISRTKDFLESFRRQWYLENKTLGFDTQEIRIGGVIESLSSAALRLNDYLKGNLKEIEELTYPVLAFAYAKGTTEPEKQLSFNGWTTNATASIL